MPPFTSTSSSPQGATVLILFQTLINVTTLYFTAVLFLKYKHSSVILCRGRHLFLLMVLGFVIFSEIILAVFVTSISNYKYAMSLVLIAHICECIYIDSIYVRCFRLFIVSKINNLKLEAGSSSLSNSIIEKSNKLRSYLKPRFTVYFLLAAFTMSMSFHIFGFFVSMSSQKEPPESLFFLDTIVIVLIFCACIYFTNNLDDYFKQKAELWGHICISLCSRLAQGFIMYYTPDKFDLWPVLLQMLSSLLFMYIGGYYPYVLAKREYLIQKMKKLDSHYTLFQHQIPWYHLFLQKLGFGNNNSVLSSSLLDAGEDPDISIEEAEDIWTSRGSTSSINSSVNLNDLPLLPGKLTNEKSHNFNQQLDINDWDLQMILQDDFVRPFFKQFLVREFSVENLLFWLDVTKFIKAFKDEHIDTTSPHYHDYIETIEIIHRKFIEVDSPCQININSFVRDQITTHLSQPVPPINIFKESLSEISHLMETDSLSRFKHSTEWNEMLAIIARRGGTLDLL